MATITGTGTSSQRYAVRWNQLGTASRSGAINASELG